MLSDKLKALEAAKAKTAALEAEVASERANVLKALPAQYGFDNANEFVSAVLEASGKRKGRGRPARKAQRRGGRKPRAKVTDETRAEVKALVKAGKTGKQVAETLGISLPTVQNIKKALGLVEARK